MLSHYQSETEILNICTFCRKLFANRDNYHLYRLQKNCPSTKTTNICTVRRKLFINRDNYHLYCLQKIVCQQRYLTSVLFVNRHNRSLYCPTINTTWPSIFHVTYQSEFHTKPEKLQKNIHVTIYISMLSMYV